MIFGVTYRSVLSYKQVFYRRFNMPYYAVVMRSAKTGIIAEDRDTALALMEIVSNTYVQTYNTKEEAETFLKSVNVKITKIVSESFGNETENGTQQEVSTSNSNSVQPNSNPGQSNSNPGQSNSNPGQSNSNAVQQVVTNTIQPNMTGIKRKRAEKDARKESRLVVKDNIKKIKSSFSDLQDAVASLPGLSTTYKHQLKRLNDQVIYKLHKILKVQKLNVDEDDLFATIMGYSKDKTQDKSQDARGRRNGCHNGTNVCTTTIVSSQIETAKKTFSFNINQEVIAYTDGACSNNGSDKASAGAGVWFGNNHPLNLSLKVPGTQTNNNAEIYAVIKAIDCVKSTGLAKINIHTDSEFVIKSVNDWMPKWKTNGWKTSAGGEVKNKDMFMMLEKKIESMGSVSWTHVAGHSGNIGNEEADKLAKQGANM